MGNNSVVWHISLVSREQREAASGHRAAVVWLTGLPGSGKSTIAHAVEYQLFRDGRRAFVLDGDNIRHGLSSDLGFRAADREEHLRRTAEVAKLMYEAGMIVLGAFVSPSLVSRARVRSMILPGPFLEVYCRCPLDVCERRDHKGFYAKARAGRIPEYTGISAPYEEPPAPELVLDTASESVESCATAVIRSLQRIGVVACNAVQPAGVQDRSKA